MPSGGAAKTPVTVTAKNEMAAVKKPRQVDEVEEIIVNLLSIWPLATTSRGFRTPLRVLE
jgi:hypothetical protein